MSILPHRFIVVEGPIGVGKTTLARRLAETFSGELLREQAEDNPFLDRFYRDPKGNALQTQLFFLFQRARQMQELRQRDMFSPLYVTDFLLDKDRLFAELNLDDDELMLYNQVYQTLALQAPRPDLVIYLQAPIEVLHKRIAKRGIAHEQFINSDYLARLSNAYASYFYAYNDSPLLIVNASEIDLVESEQDFAELLKQIQTIKNGRHFFNPIPMNRLE
jgi:deoxyadenosine/deoxycytidine kinase